MCHLYEDEEEEEGKMPPWSFSKTLGLFPKQRRVSRAAKACFMLSRPRVQAGQLIACCYQWGEQRLYPPLGRLEIWIRLVLPCTRLKRELRQTQWDSHAQ